MLPVNFLFRQTVHDHPDGRLRAQRYDAEPFGLSIGPILEELHVLKVRHADVSDSVSYVLIRRPLKKVTDNSTTRKTRRK